MHAWCRCVAVVAEEQRQCWRILPCRTKHALHSRQYANCDLHTCMHLPVHSLY